MKNKELFQLLEKSRTISIFTHVSPDPDAVASGLLTYRFIKNNFKDKDIIFNIEGGVSSHYSFLKGFQDISDRNTFEFLQTRMSDLVIIVDANNYRNLSRNDEVKIREFVQSKNIKTVIIDNHPGTYKDNSDIYINNNSSSAAEEIFRIFTEDFEFKLFDGAAEAAMFGILADTNRFLYNNSNHRETFKVVSKLLDEGVSIEALWNKIYVLKKNHALVIAELLKNIRGENDFNYSYVSDDFAKEFVKKGGDWDTFSDAFYIFVDQYIRYIEGNVWGFAIIPDFSNNNSEYRGAFRALNDYIDTSVFAREFGGGGYKSASGFSIKSKNDNEALQKVKDAIKRLRN